MGQKETRYLKHALVRLSKHGYRLFRNNVGLTPADPAGRRVRYGLCRGSSDLVGWLPTTVTQDDVGRTLAVFAAVEVKTPEGLLSVTQRRFLAAVQAAGGVALVVRGNTVQPYSETLP